MKKKESSKITFYSGVHVARKRNVGFSSKEKQLAYFSRRAVLKDVTAGKSFSYLRRNSAVKVEMTMAQAKTVDYMSFVNPDFENEIIYAKVIDYRYVSNKVTLIEYAIDSWQSHMRDVSYGSCLKIREHDSVANKKKAQLNPFDPSLHKLQTAEDFPVSLEMEEYYIKSDGLDGDMFDFPQQGAGSVELWFISDFDTEPFDDIQSSFYDKFDQYVLSDGKYFADGLLSGQIPINVGRGFGIYALYVGGEKWRNKKEVFDWMTAQGVAKQIINQPQVGIATWLIYTRHFENAKVKNGTYVEITPKMPDVQNEKLLLYPFNFIRVENNEGDATEYKYEMFRSLQDGEGRFDLALIPMIDSMTTVSLLPLRYRHSGSNIYERIDCSVFPQIGYTTDAYKDFVATQMANELGSKTDTVKERLLQRFEKGARNRLDTLNSGIEYFDSSTPKAKDGRYLPVASASALAGNALRALKRAEVGFDTVVQDVYNGSEGFDLGAKTTNSYAFDVINYRSGGDTPTTFFDYAKSAYVNDLYTPGSSTGSLGYYLDDQKAPGVFTIFKACIKETIRNIYDRAMSEYGYADGSYGTPLICNFVKGSQIEDNIPYFADVDGIPVTYIWTSGMKVYYADENTSRAIEDMFDSGVSIINGDDL